MKQALPVLRFLRDCARRGERAALITLTDVTGSAARAPGEHMAVAEGGAFVGSFSGGCVEAAVVAEAQEVIAAGEARVVRFGAGSRYIDIRLPCGGGIDLLFSSKPDPAQLDRAIALLEARQPITLHLARQGPITTSLATDLDGTGWGDAGFDVRHDPMLRLVVLGHGAEPGALLDVARAYRAETLLLSPQAALVHDERRAGGQADQLRVIGRSDRLVVDPWTAVIALFHDHGWETELLLQAIDQRPFFIGAMGSRRTHAERLHRLAEAGGERRQIERVAGPIGLIAATRDPGTLAISVMAQVVQAYEALLSSRAEAQFASASALNSAHRCNEKDGRDDTGRQALHLASGSAAQVSDPRASAGQQGR